MADELEENYVLDSDTEYGGEAGETVALEYDPQPVHSKRKRDDAGSAGAGTGTGAVGDGAGANGGDADGEPEFVTDNAVGPAHVQNAPASSTAERNKRRRLAKKARKAERVENSASASGGRGGGGGGSSSSQEERIAVLPPDVQAEHMRTFLAKAFPKKSSLELSEIEVPERAFAPVTALSPERDLDSLIPLLHAVDAAFAPHEGHVELLVVSGNANRCTDLARALRPLLAPRQGGGHSNGSGSASRASQGKDKNKDKKKQAKHPPKPREEAVIAKLFARHMKRSEQAALLQSKTPTPVAVGTPGRIEALLSAQDEENTAPLDGRQVRYVVLDASWKDAKQFSLLDSPDTKRDVFSLLAHPALRSQWGDSLKLVLF